MRRSGGHLDGGRLMEKAGRLVIAEHVAASQIGVSQDRRAIIVAGPV